MELNGIANLHILVDQLPIDNGEDLETYNKIKEQLDLLERYMLAVQDAIKTERNNYNNDYARYEEIPAWHEVRENPAKYPLNKER